MKKTRIELSSQYRKLLIRWMTAAIGLFLLYGGLLLIEAFFYDGDMHVAVVSIAASAPLITLAIILSIYPHRTRFLPLYMSVATQIVFIIFGTYLHELDFYFYITLILIGMVSIIRDFKLMAATEIAMIVINSCMVLFFIPHLNWINPFRVFMQFTMCLFGTLFMLIQTNTVTRKESRADQALSAFSSLLTSTPNYMIITDSENRVRYISEPMVRFAGVARQQFAIGQPLLDLFSDRALKLMFSDILDAKSFVETITPITIDGEQRHFKVTADKLSGDKGGLFIDIADITPLENSRKAAEAANASKSNFLANMSHEIRTPMNAIIGVAQIQLQNPDLPQDYADALNIIYNSGTNLLGIINDILDMSKIETGKMELNPINYDMPSLINDAVQLNIVRIDAKPIEFILDIHSDLPSRMFGDELRLKQILNNLLSNAIKYTDKGYIKLSVTHTPQEEDMLLHFTVEDTGQGMKPEDRDRLFSEYLRFNSDANRTTEGTGLGLNITKRLVEAMNGSIDVESEYGKGSIFTVTVRQKYVDCPAIGAELSERLSNFTFTKEKQPSNLRITHEPMPYGRVLIVDDVETNLYVAEGLLTPYKLQIETANGGYSAISKIESGKIYDVIFMDHMMPQIDGIETTKRIRALGYTGSIVALTANALVGNKELFKQNGFDGFISKPIDIRNLNTSLNKFVRDKHPEEASKWMFEAPSEKTRPVLPSANITQKLFKFFQRDALKAIAILKDTVSSDNIKLFTTTVHGMKSALANIGELETSELALELEKAGRCGNYDYISANADKLIKALEALVQSSITDSSVTNTTTKDNSFSTSEDMALLATQLSLIKAACLNYDDTAAYAALDLLRTKSWDLETNNMLEHIYDMLFLHSDFEGVVEKISLHKNEGFDE